jgi:hypothetical protein
MPNKDKAKTAAAASKTYQQEKEKVKVKTPQIRIEGVRYDVPNKQVGQKIFKEIVAKNPTVSLKNLKESIADEGYRLNEKAKDYFHENKNVLNQPEKKEDPQVNYDPNEDKDGDGKPDAPSAGAGPFEWQAYRDIVLGGLQKETATESETIRGLSNQEIAKINKDASNYGYDRQLEGTKYATDSEERWRQAVATIEGDKKASLQNIINAGLKDVSEIEGSYSLKNVEAKGKYDTQIMGLRTQADKDIAKMDANQKMYGLLGLAFG